MIPWIAIAVLALAAIVLVARDDAGTVLGLLNEDFARLAALSALTFVIGGALFWRLRGNPGGGIRMVAIWLALAAVLIIGYTFRHDAGTALTRVLGELVPGMAIEMEGGRVAVARAGNGHFVLDMRVNGAAMTMLFDTGASTVVLTPEDAARAGIDVGGLVYSAPVWTANGRTTAAPVLLDRVEIGSIAVERVRAVVARPGGLAESLLGMSFLDRIPTWRVERDRLILGG